MKIQMVDELTAVQVAGLCACAFDFSSEEHLKNQEELLQERNIPKTYNDFCWKDRVVALEGDTVIATIGCYQYQVYFENQIVNMSAIGGVATYPEYRNSGAIKACFQKSFEYMQENNQIVSFLYPFSSAYYRKFGYGPLCTYTKWNVPMNDLPKITILGSFHLHKIGESIEDIKQVYNQFACNFNMMVVRHPLHFECLENNDPFKENVYLYTYCNEDQQPTAYVCLKRADDDILKVLDYAFVDLDGLKAIIHIISKFSSSFDSFEMDMESSFSLDLLIPEITGIKRTTHTSSCVRIIDVQKVLEIVRYKGDGRIVIGVMDSFIERNNAFFDVRFQEGRATSIKRCNIIPNIVLDIADFSSLISGHSDIIDFLLSKEPELDLLEKVFYKKRCMIRESF